jgi:hypothetical protein
MVQFPTEERQFSFLQSVQTEFGAQPASYSMGTEALPALVKWQGYEVAPFFLSSAEAQNALSYISTFTYAFMACTRTTLISVLLM